MNAIIDWLPRGWVRTVYYAVVSAALIWGMLNLPAHAGPTFNTYGPAAGIQKNTGTTPQNTTAMAADVAGAYTGASGCTGAAALLFNATCAPFPTVPVGANPSATIGLSVINGTAATFMRSDAAPPLSQSISPTWSGSHTFSNIITVNGISGTTANPHDPGPVLGVQIGLGAAGVGNTLFEKDPVSGSAGVFQINSGFAVGTGDGGSMDMYAGNAATQGTGGSEGFAGGAGAGTGQGGNIQMLGGLANGGQAGSVDIAGGSGLAGGQTSMTGGNSTGAFQGGSVVITGGNSSGATQQGGDTNFAAGNDQATGGHGGDVTFNPGLGVTQANDGSTGFFDAQFNEWLSQGPTDVIVLGVTGAGSLQLATQTEVGSPTGGFKGAGSLNAQSLFVNNVAVSTAAGANPTATVGASVVNGTATTYMRSDAAPALSTLGSAGSCTYCSVTFDANGRESAQSSGTAPPVGANPSGSIGLTANNGVATSFDRSDSTHALSQNIAPTWTGSHLFTGQSVTGVTTTGVSLGITGGQPEYDWIVSGAATNSKLWDMTAGGTDMVGRVINDANSAAETWIDITRSAATISKIALETGGSNIRLSINASGDVVVTSPAAGDALDVTGNGSGNPLSLHSLITGAGNGFLCGSSAGPVTFQTTATCGTSAERFKQKIVSLPLGLNAVLALRPVTYHLRPEFDPEKTGDREYIGFIAEEVEQIAPDLVTHDSDGKTHSMSYDRITAILVNGEKDIESQIWTLRAAFLVLLIWNCYLTWGGRYVRKR